MSNQNHAFVRITGATGAIVARNGAVTSVTRNAAGDFTLVMSSPLAVAERNVLPVVVDTDAGFAVVEEVDAATVRVRTSFEIGVLDDPIELTISVERIRFLRS